MRAWPGLSAACAAVVEHLLSEPPRRMDSEAKGPMSRGRPQAAAERSDDRVRTVAQPAALDSGPCELCVDQEVASNADVPRHTPQNARPPRTRTWQRAAARPGIAPLPPQRLEKIVDAMDGRGCRGLVKASARSAPRWDRPEPTPPAAGPATGPSGLNAPGHARLVGMDTQALRGRASAGPVRWVDAPGLAPRTATTGGRCPVPESPGPGHTPRGPGRAPQDRLEAVMSHPHRA